MASAFLSLPPPWTFGASDLKRNARKFLERALVISALLHLAAVGVFRAALERFAATEEPGPPAIPHWSPPIDITHIIEFSTGRPPTVDTRYKLGEIIPVKKGAELSPVDPNFPGAEPGPVTADPRPGPSGSDNAGGPPDLGPPERTLPFTHVDTPPVPTVAPRPSYPPWAKEAGIEGKVLARVLVGADGIPKRAVVVSGPKGLTEGIESALLRWRFKPGLMNGTPVDCWVEIPISFRLGE